MSIKKNNASSNIVYKGLRDDILSLKLIPGSAISETDIASKYNVHLYVMHLKLYQTKDYLK